MLHIFVTGDNRTVYCVPRREHRRGTRSADVGTLPHHAPDLTCAPSSWRGMVVLAPSHGLASLTARERRRPGRDADHVPSAPHPPGSFRLSPDAIIKRVFFLQGRRRVRACEIYGGRARAAYDDTVARGSYAITPPRGRFGVNALQWSLQFISTERPIRFSVEGDRAATLNRAPVSADEPGRGQPPPWPSALLSHPLLPPVIQADAPDGTPAPATLPDGNDDPDDTPVPEDNSKLPFPPK